mmetsp:Transcript_110471/g.165337  ORF Transcript_110471/g.165337 Transcript_110471/m.165337 type:complete len:157 (+) Transcript_110471:286-756(+)
MDAKMSSSAGGGGAFLGVTGFFFAPKLVMRGAPPPMAGMAGEEAADMGEGVMDIMPPGDACCLGLVRDIPFFAAGEDAAIGFDCSDKPPLLGPADTVLGSRGMWCSPGPLCGTLLLEGDFPYNVDGGDGVKESSDGFLLLCTLPSSLLLKEGAIST